MSTIDDARVLPGDPNGLMTPLCSGNTLKLRTLAGGENGFTVGALAGGVPTLGVRNERLRGVTGGELPGVPWCCGICAAVLAWWASRKKPGLGGSLSGVFIPLPVPLLPDPMAKLGLGGTNDSGGGRAEEEEEEDMAIRVIAVDYSVCSIKARR
jgi:hypothetical protein